MRSLWTKSGYVLDTLKLYKLNRLRNRAYILAYHMIVDRPNGFYPETATEIFRRHMVHLVKYYQVMSLDDIARRVLNKESLRGCAAITFDDGFRDNYTHAYPILKEHNFPATIFLTTDNITSGIAPWFIRLRYIFMTTRVRHLAIELDSGVVSLPMTDASTRRRASDIVMAYVQRCSNEERTRFLDDLDHALKVKQFDTLHGLMLTWDQVKEMAKNGISFGAHTVNHPVLSRISLDEARDEILDSKDLIEEKTNTRVTSFAYPFGRKKHYTPDVTQLLKSLHFSCAVTTVPGSITSNTDLFQLHRFPPWPLSMI